MNWIVLIIVLLLAALVLTVVIRTLRFKPLEKPASAHYKESAGLDGAKKLAQAVRIPTITYLEPEKIDRPAFARFGQLLEELFPLVHKSCKKTVIGGYSMVYHLKSDTPEHGKKPVLITAHMDVVPVEEGTEKDWGEPPFSGNIKNGVVWGRGTLDTKVHIIGAMEALERLLAQGFSPKRDIWMAFGHDEELNGEEGALKIAAYLQDQGLEFDFVLDEGGCVVTDVIGGIDRPVALVGVGEKGYANIHLSVTTDGGHSSMPAPHTSLGILAKALCRIESRPLKPRLITVTSGFLKRIGPHMKGLNRVILANLWLFKPLFLSVFSKMNSGNALLRTTVAVTMAQGSPAPNVVPQKSSAVVNCRILPGEDGRTLINHLRKTLKGLPVELEPIHLDDPSSLSPGNTEAFRYLEGLIEEFCPDAIVAPYLVMASTDARKYECVSRNVYRFTPYVVGNGELGKMHGTNENISVANVNRCIDFFEALFARL